MMIKNRKQYMVKIALVFPIFNKLEYTRKGLADVYHCFDAKGTDLIPIDIVITDDNSSDGSFEWIKMNYPNIHLLKGDGTLWWSGGVNKAIQYVLKNLESEYVLLWNNDIYKLSIHSIYPFYIDFGKPSHVILVK